MYDLIIIGAGVSGLMAAGVAAQRGLNVLVLEKMEKPARKLRITGKGRCNITNTKEYSEFIGKVRSGASFLSYAYQQFDNQATISYFNSIGVRTEIERGGRVFPASGKAWDVADGMVNWAKSQTVNILCNSIVLSVAKTDDQFEIVTQTDKYLSKNLLIATGGVSYPATGSTGDGYMFAHQLGHSIVAVRPALVPLVAAETSGLMGLALKNTKATLLVDNVEVDYRFGDVEFTDRGLAGAVILQLSRDAVDAISDSKKVAISLDLKSALSHQKLVNRIIRDITEYGEMPLSAMLKKLIPSQLQEIVGRRTQMSLNKVIKLADNSSIDTLAYLLKNLVFDIVDYRPFTEAIITAGGVSLDEIDHVTMQSKITSNLYFSGEVMDIDADTGGYNIQVALSTAVLAAKSMSK